MKPPRVIVIEALPPEICEACGRLEELRPYGKRKATGNRMWVCWDCASKDPADRDRAIEERFDGKNPV